MTAEPTDWMDVLRMYAPELDDQEWKSMMSAFARSGYGVMRMLQSHEDRQAGCFATVTLDPYAAPTETLATALEAAGAAVDEAARLFAARALLRIVNPETARELRELIDGWFMTVH